MYSELFENIIYTSGEDTDDNYEADDFFAKINLTEKQLARLFEQVLKEAMQNQSVDELKTSLKTAIKTPEKNNHLFNQMHTEKEIDDYPYNELKPENSEKGVSQSFSEKVVDNSGKQCGTLGYRKFTPTDSSGPSFDQIKFWSTSKGNNRLIVQDAVLKIISFLRDEHAKLVSWEMIKGNDVEFGYRALCQLFGVKSQENKNNLLFKITAEDYENNRASIDNLQSQQIMLKIARLSRELRSQSS
jgi:hypothetical protein